MIAEITLRSDDGKTVLYKLHVAPHSLYHVSFPSAVSIDGICLSWMSFQWNGMIPEGVAEREVGKPEERRKECRVKRGPPGRPRRRVLGGSSGRVLGEEPLQVRTGLR